MKLTNRQAKELLAQEYLKCKNDPAYFIYNYVKIQHPQKGLIDFKLYDFQGALLKNFQSERYNIILKSRQLGISTLTAAYATWLMSFYHDKNILVIAMKGDVAVNMIRKVKVAIKHLPPWMQPKITVDNRTSIEISNGSMVKAVGKTPDAGRSEAISLLIIDEAAFIGTIDEVWAASQQTLATGGSAIVVSTPNGRSGWFYKTYMEAENGVNDFCFVELPWQVHPDRDEEWRKEQTKVLGEQMSAQECDADFISSGFTIIEGDKIRTLEDRTSDPVEKQWIDNQLWIWKYPTPKGKYLIAADIATGHSADYNACHVIDLETVEQVAEYKGQVEPADFGNGLVNLGIQYNNALLVIENNSLGIAAIQPAIDNLYRNIYYSKRGTVDVIDPIKHPYVDAVHDKNARAGFNTNTKTRPLIINKLEKYIRSDSILINSKRTIDELWTFIFEKGKAQAARGNNDDLIMALAIAVWVRDTALKMTSLTEEYDKRRSDWTKVTTVPSASDLVYQKRFNEDPWKIQIGTGYAGSNSEAEEDIRWLL